MKKIRNRLFSLSNSNCSWPGVVVVLVVLCRPKHANSQTLPSKWAVEVPTTHNLVMAPTCYAMQTCHDPWPKYVIWTDINFPWGRKNTLM